VNCFWYQKPDDEDDGGPDRQSVVPGLNHVLAAQRDDPPAETWSQVVADFRQALHAASALRDERTHSHDTHARHIAAQRESDAVRDRQQRPSTARAPNTTIAGRHSRSVPSDDTPSHT
jgi:hypothetical protein